MLLYDVTNERSFVSVREWIEAVDVSQKKCTKKNNDEIFESKIYPFVVFDSKNLFISDIGCRRETHSNNVMC